MANTLATFATGLRVDDTSGDVGTDLQGVLDAVSAFIASQVVSDIPDAIADRAEIMMGAHIWDMPPATRGDYAQAWHHSGASALTMPWQSPALPEEESQ